MWGGERGGNCWQVHTPNPPQAAERELVSLRAEVAALRTGGGAAAVPSRAYRAARVISDCHFAVQLNHFIPILLSCSVAIFLK